MSIKHLRVDRRLVRITKAYHDIAEYFSNLYSETGECVATYQEISNAFKLEVPKLREYIISGKFKDVDSSEIVIEYMDIATDYIITNNANAYILDELRNVNDIIFDMSFDVLWRP